MAPNDHLVALILRFSDLVCDMRQWLGRVAMACPIVLLSMWPTFVALAAEPQIQIDEHRGDALVYLLQQDCGSCHGLTLKGGLGPPLLPRNLADKADETLVNIVLNGVPGTPMPPWAGQLSHDEALWLIRQMKEGKLGVR